MATADLTREFNLFEEIDRAVMQRYAFLSQPSDPDLFGVDLGAGMTVNGYPRARVLTEVGAD